MTDIRPLAGQIAANIRRRGHWRWRNQEKYGSVVGGYCVVENPAWGNGESARPDEEAAELEALAVAILGHTSDPYHDLTVWNDETPTSGVLETLDRIASS